MGLVWKNETSEGRWGGGLVREGVASQEGGG